MKDTRTQILDSALQLFVERGFHATPTSAITKHAGVSAGILFHYFPSKNDLVIELYAGLKMESFETGFQGLGKMQSMEGKLRLLWSNLWNWGLANPLKFRFIQQGDHSTYQQAVYENKRICELMQKAYAFLQDAIDQKVLKNVDVSFLGLTFYALIGAMVQHINQHPELRNDPVFIEQAWEMHYQCIKP